MSIQTMQNSKNAPKEQNAYAHRLKILLLELSTRLLSKAQRIDVKAKIEVGLELGTNLSSTILGISFVTHIVG